ncbi:MAG: hypothetical protein LN413_04320 [Candidatus Thermoplasmatota archaeon]|nr:hypothetical protein [Candidatus Thermoplasmatota archaeon]
MRTATETGPLAHQGETEPDPTARDDEGEVLEDVERIVQHGEVEEERDVPDDEETGRHPEGHVAVRGGLATHNQEVAGERLGLSGPSDRRHGHELIRGPPGPDPEDEGEAMLQMVKALVALQESVEGGRRIAAGERPRVPATRPSNRTTVPR